ncbi:MAG: TetR/AcrR family transcriptional regulator [Acidimicrobiia bacterium]|nr:TetR/AcrR family transcriptional regulator [Acidimicrobiia bacterium]
MKRGRGRPRDPNRDRAILSAARAAIAQHGYTGATMDAIAKSAGVGKDTLYRRWTSKEQLALDVVQTMARDSVRPAAIDPDPRINLFLFLKDIVRLNQNTHFGPLVAGLVGEAARNDLLAKRFAEFWERRRVIAAQLIRDVAGSDVSDAEIETYLDGLLGPIYYRLLLTRAELTDDYLWSLIVEIPWPAVDHSAWDQAATA